MHNGKWKDIKIIKENLSVKGEPDREIELTIPIMALLHILIKRHLKLMLLDVHG